MTHMPPPKKDHGPPTKRFRVHLSECLTAELDAANEADAWDRYKVHAGINGSDHTPAISILGKATGEPPLTTWPPRAANPPPREKPVPLQPSPLLDQAEAEDGV